MAEAGPWGSEHYVNVCDHKVGSHRNIHLNKTVLACHREPARRLTWQFFSNFALTMYTISRQAIH
jgi:hypothetical protein